MMVTECPRCGGYCSEHLRTHKHCWDCGYSPDESVSLRVRKEVERESYRSAEFAKNELTDDQLDQYFSELQSEEGDEK